jgi:hypothetical protein
MPRNISLKYIQLTCDKYIKTRGRETEDISSHKNILYFQNKTTHSFLLTPKGIYQLRSKAEVETREIGFSSGLWKGVQLMKGKNVPFVPLICSRSKVIEFFLSGHRIPNLVSLAKTNISTWQSWKLGLNAHVLVLPSIVKLSSNKQDNIVSCDTQEDLVAGVIERFIFILIDLHWMK